MRITDDQHATQLASPGSASRPPLVSTRVAVLKLAVGLALLGCTPTVTNKSPDVVPRNSSNSYTLTAEVTPRSNTIVGVDALVGESPWPMSNIGSNRYSGAVGLSPCVGTVTFKYQVRYQRNGSSTVRQLVSPSSGHHALGISGEVPEMCPDTFSKVFEVRSTTDAVDANLEDGQCRTAAGQCTLRAAIMQANRNSGHDIIQLRGGDYELTLGGNEAPDVANAAIRDLDVTDSVSILGPPSGSPARIIGGNQRIFDLHVAPDGGFIDIGFVELRDAHVSDDGPGGAIHNRGTTRVRRVTFDNNRLSNQDIAHSCAAYVGRRECNRGGAIFNEGTLTVEESTFKNNRTCSASDCVSNSGHGGAISNFGASARLTVDKSTFTGNSARFVGAIMNYLGSVAVKSSTLSGNRGDWSSTLYTYGGGLDVSHSTIANTSTQAIRTTTPEDGPAPATIVRSTIIHAYSGPRNLCVGPTISGGNNVFGGDGSWSESSAHNCGSNDTDLVGSFLLGSLTDNGGPTETISIYAPPSSGSSSLNLNDVGGSSCPNKDQRGVSRPRDGDGDGTAACDPGAYER